MIHPALQRLLDGNRRYVTHRSKLDTSRSRRAEVAKGQKPFAIVFGCVDSRVPPELVFDQGLGELFVIRTAGEVLDQAALGSLEFGVEELHIPLLVVLGHARCGAVKAAIEVQEGHLRAHGEIAFLAKALVPAIAQGELQGGELWDKAGHAQVQLTVERLKNASILKEAVERGELIIVGAWYNLETGEVEVLD